jgi:hypothetical protein
VNEEEQMCREMIRHYQEQCENACRPYFERLTKIEQCKSPSMTITKDQYDAMIYPVKAKE